MKCFIPLSSTNFLNSIEVKAGPLSDTITSGNPCIGNVMRSFSIVADDDVDGTICASIHFECASTMISIVLP